MSRPRTRRVLSRIVLVVAAVLLPVGLIAGWANSTLYDSQSFSRRSVELLDDPTVRRELAARLTEQLARSGNRQAVNFRPAFQLAVEAVIDTDTFHSIFRTAVFQVHQALLSDNPDTASLDLSDSVDIIVSNLQLPTDAKPGQNFNGSLGNSLSDTTHRLAALHIWQLDAIAGALTIVGVGGAIVLGGLSIALADDRRRATRRAGWAVAIDGLVVLAAVQVTILLVGRAIADGRLSAAVQAGLGRGMADLVTVGLWVAGYGVVLAAAASTRPGHRFSPRAVVGAVNRWIERRRATTGGTVVLGAGALLAGVLLIEDPFLWLRIAVVTVALYALTYAGVTELLSLVHRVAVPVGTPANRGRRLAILTAATVVLTVMMVGGLLVFTRRAATRAEAAGTPQCNGASSLCDLPLSTAMFPGSHNSMSSALYPGFLFAEQIGTIRDQLDAGVRALFIDTHYGIPSSARLPGSNTPVILTDRAAELSAPPGDDVDAAITARAAQLSAQAPPAADAQRGIYLCHNSCELGAVPFSSALGEVQSFLEANPDEVVMLMIQDATTPADTAAAIEQAGLADRAYTLQTGQPMPTLGELIQSRHNLLVFAESGGSGGPDWYQPGYQWFQETPYTFAGADAFSCGPNRGPADAPLFLVNHWVGVSPDPDAAAEVNTGEALSARLEACLQQRGLLPNVIAVDFAEPSAVVKTVAALNQSLVRQVRSIKGSISAGRASGSPAATTDTTTGPAPPDDAGLPSVVRPPTTITTLTGGDPARFCADVDPALAAISAWALASLGAPAGNTSRPDLTYAPLVSRVLTPLLPAAPRELEARLGPADRVNQALAALTALGLDAAAIDRLADLAGSALAGPTPDAQAIDQQVTDQIVASVGQDPFDAATRAFAQQHPRPTDLFDLGDVTPAVAVQAEWRCLGS